ncbi:hypothetical protein P154DRAFT_431787 [Amniculicola lignicola CBS 123094]|uniref:NADH dehydrogenase [ubiquinone] 1 alpha subcomplex assembly factor 3 n=1 Tax=Amniculicola lignicola CBS 123094 TaxID=1392246 RepID=A0A6A5WJH8_9PLEO|nr:hypothetical protein P154DRAFT_431787 [Amniculicola lignicola CBS 123094]
MSSSALRAASSSRPPHAPPAHRTPHTYRYLHATAPSHFASRPPKTRDRGPKSNEDTQTDFGALDVLRNTVAPASSIDACTNDGFALNNNMKIGGSGIMLVGGEVFRWRPWLKEGEGEGEGTAGEGGLGEITLKGRLKNEKGQWHVDNGAWGVLELVWPKPDLLIIGTGGQVTPISPTVRRYLNDLGIRLEISDTRNASAQFNLLATERGVQQVAAALIPMGWREGHGLS